MNQMGGEFVERATYTLQFQNCTAGLGIKVIGGISEEDEDDIDFGIFIRSILSGGVAAQDGRLKEGDQILQVNSESLEKVTNDQAVTCLRLASASDAIELVVCRDELAREEYLNLLNNYSYSSASSVYEQSSFSANPDIGSKNSWGIPEGQAQSIDSSTPSNTPKNHTIHFNSSEQHQEQSGSRLRPYSSPPYEEYSTLHMDGSYLPPRALMLSEPDLAYVHGAAHLYPKGLLVPAQHSTPEHATHLKHSPPDGASGHSQNGHVMYRPSPVSASDSYYNRPQEMTSPAAGQFSNTGGKQRSGLYRKPTLDTFVKLPVEKLEVALQYLGLQPSEEQRQELRNRLKVDQSGMVSYGDFVQEARVLFHYELEQRGITPGAMYMAGENILHFADASHSSMNSAPTSARSLEAEIQRIRQERNHLRLEISRLRSVLKEKERACNSTEEELLRVRKEAQGAIHECRALKTKLHLAESAQRTARTMEQDYIEVVALLESEIAQLKALKAKTPDSSTFQKRITVLNCQLKKSELSRKAHEVTTEKLLQFAQKVYDTLSNHGDISREGNKRQRAPATQQLATEARDTIKSVRSLLESELT